MKTIWKIERYERTGDSTWSVTPDVLTTDFTPYQIMTREKLGDGRDSFSWDMVNFDDTLNDYFNVGDKVTISRGVDTSTLDSDNVIMNGVINDLPYDVDGSKIIQKIKGVNYTETLMNAVAFVGAQNLPIDQFFQQALNSVAAFNDNFKVTWNSANPSTLSDGTTTFPTVTERWYNKSIMKALEKFSRDKFTTDGNYYFYVDKNNTLVWRREEGNPIHSFNSETNTDYTSMKISKDTKDVINFIIAKSGNTSPKGDIIAVRVDDAVSRAKHGFKPYFMVTQGSNADILYNADGVENKEPSGYPFTTSWVSSINRPSSPTMVEGSTVTVASLTEYNTAITLEVKARMKKDAQALLAERSLGKLTVEVVFPSGKATSTKTPWGLGDVVSVTIPQINKTNNNMRVQERELRTEEERYVLIEDEGTI